MLRFLFPNAINNRSASISLLILRIVFGGMLLIHGWAKMTNFDTISEHFVGGSFGLGLAVFAEVFCSLGVIFGVLYRLALIPMIITMGAAFFGTHGVKIIGEGNGELALLYLAVFVALFLMGAGKYAGDGWIANKLKI